ncbi:MAG: hypothetical protein QME05_06360 [Candidatus Margulisbacteria bacterium]|nr:hypothetical protein [Candidatus Margulisiibacteriota bacterium]
MGLEHVNQQQVAIAGNLSAAEGLAQVIQAEFDGQTEADNSSKVSLRERILKKALEGKKGNLGNEIIASLANKLAQTMPTANILANVENEYSFLLDPQNESTDDFIAIKDPLSKAAKDQKEKQQQNIFNNSAETETNALQKPSGDVQDYITAYSQMLVNGGDESKKKIEQMERQLVEEKGLPVKDLMGIKSKVASSVRGEVLQQVKQAFMKRVLTDSKSISWVSANRELKNFVDYAFLNTRLSGGEFGGGEGEGLVATLNQMKEDVKGEMKDFVNDVLKEEVAKKVMGSEDKQVDRDIEMLLKLGQKVGFDPKGFAEQMLRMKEDLGLNPLISFEYAPIGGNSANSDQQNQRQYQYTPEDEKDVLTDKLRALYMRRAMQGDLRTVLETQFKMIKTKNGLIRLGIQNFDQIETEGKALAKIKLFDMLREGFEERATYAKLSGPAWEMTERKMKTVLKNMEKLGVALSSTELDSLRDKANERMLSEAAHEFALINTAIEIDGERAYLTQKKKMVKDIMERLSQESGLQAPGVELELTVEEAC